LSDASCIEVTPGATMLTDNYVVAPPSMWNLRSKDARRVMEFSKKHPTVGVIIRWYHDEKACRPSRLLGFLREFDAFDYADVEMLGKAEVPGGSYGKRRFYRIHSGNGTTYLNADWADVFLARGCSPAVYKPLKAVQWQDEKGQRVGYQMPAILPEKLKGDAR